MQTYRKYDTCFFERYALISLQEILGHKFDGLVNMDRPDLQSPDGKSLGIEVTRAMEGGKKAAQQMLKDIAGLGLTGSTDYVYGLDLGDGIDSRNYAGGLELSYWSTAKPLKEIISNKLYKVSSGFYGSFEEFGLFIFCKDALTEESVTAAVHFTLELQEKIRISSNIPVKYPILDDAPVYSRLFLSDGSSLYACNLEDDIADEFRISIFPVSREQRHSFYLRALEI